MITSKEDLKSYNLRDAERNLWQNPLPWYKYILAIIYQRADVITIRYLKALRRYEYATNCKKGRGIFANLYYIYSKWMWNKRGLQANIEIGPNMVGPGLKILHSQTGGVIINCHSMGCDCCVTAGVVVGNKDCQDNRAIIGNNVTITLGAKVIGKVTLGNNSIIAPNSVVIHDVPENGIVSGVPAKLINMRE